MQTTAIQTTVENKRDIRNFISSDAVLKQMAMVLPKHLTPDRMARVAITAIMRVPKLLQCTQDSLLNCLMQCSQMGLEPDGRLAHLIPFENKKKKVTECTLIIDWKGLAQLALRGGTIAKLHADLICDADEFAFDMGEILHHRIDFRKDRGQPFAAYAMATTKTGEKFVAVLTCSEIEAIRDNSQGWRSFKQGFAYSSPWQDSPGEMWKKTAFRRLAKWLPLSPEFRDAIDVDDTTDISSTVVKHPGPLPDFTIQQAITDTQEESDPKDGVQTGGTDTKPGLDNESSKSINYIKGMRGLLKLANITEGDFLDFMRATKGLDDSLSSIDEVATFAPLTLKHAYENWNTIRSEMEKAIKEIEKRGAK